MSRLSHAIHSSSPLARLAWWSFIAHGVWEFFQCLFFYDMSELGVAQGALWMLGATIADVILSVILVSGALWLNRRNSRLPLVWTLVIAGFIVAVAIETAASVGDWWHYVARMPQLDLWGVSLGLLPCLQMALLPWWSARLAKIAPFAR